MKFNQINDTTWESEAQAYSAVALNEDREPVGILEARYVIKKVERSDKTFYRLYEQHVGRKEVLGRFKTLEKAVKEVQ